MDHCLDEMFPLISFITKQPQVNRLPSKNGWTNHAKDERFEFNFCWRLLTNYLGELNQLCKVEFLVMLQAVNCNDQ